MSIPLLTRSGRASIRASACWPSPRQGRTLRSSSTPPAGAVSLDALEQVGPENLTDKILLDLALPLDFSEGFPPTLTVASIDSLGEQIQRACPDTKVVKSLTSVFCQVMVEPSRIPGEHSIFVAGDDREAKQTVGELLQSFGWPAEKIIDLGEITASRAVEMYSRLYFTLVGALGSFELNINVVRAG